MAPTPGRQQGNIATVADERESVGTKGDNEDEAERKVREKDGNR